MYKRWLKLAAIPVLALALMASSCDNQPEAQQNEQEAQQGSYEALVAGQPAQKMNYSPTRETINGWVETWNEPGKLAFVYLTNADGVPYGYYVLSGPPVSMCAALTPTYRMVYYNGGASVVPAPSVDGVYYSGGQCNQYYGFDATTGDYLEWSLGFGANYLLYESPMPWQNLEQLGFTDAADVDG